jgi:hypothetical protein
VGIVHWSRLPGFSGDRRLQGIEEEELLLPVLAQPRDGAAEVEAVGVEAIARPVAPGPVVEEVVRVEVLVAAVVIGVAADTAGRRSC